MKIIHVTPYYPPHLGGMENTVKELAEGAWKRGHDVSVYTSDKSVNVKSASKNHLCIHCLKSIKIPGVPPIIPMLPFRLLPNIDKNTIVHVHYTLNFSMDLAIIISKIKGSKIISHVHIDPLPTGPLGFLNPAYKRLFWKRILPLSDVVICPTEDYIETVSQKYDVERNRCVVVPSGIKLADFENIKTSEKISEPINILFVGRLSRQKNIPRLLEAFRLFQQRYDANLNIVGEGEDKLAIEGIIEKRRINNVIFHGRISNERLIKLYSTEDIFVLPSDFESFGIVNLEAMASGLPIVASDIPGLRNVLKGCGILVKPMPENFANAMIKLVEDDDLRRDLIKKGKEKVKDYGWDKVTDRVIEIYKKVS